MSIQNPYLKQYKKNQIETATPEQILILLYDASINFLNRAKLAINENDDELFHKNITNCRNIIIEFMNTLDMELGGKLAETLYSLYRYLHKILVKVDISKDINGIDEVLKHLTNLRETWQKAIEISNAEKDGMHVDQYTSSDSADEYDNDDEDYEEDEESDEEAEKTYNEAI